MIEWERELNDKQLEAVKYTTSPLLVLAGAGSGKTRVLTYKVAYLIEEESIPAENILLLTFTNKAAGEMRNRVASLIGKMPGFAGTFHSFCAFVLRRWGSKTGLPSNFIIYDETDKLMALKTIMKSLDMDIKKVKPSVIGSMISKAKNEMLNIDEFSEMARGEYQKKMANVWREYQKQLLAFGAVDFDDLLLVTVKLLKQDDVLSRLQEMFSYILVDEYQDTNKAQYLMTKLLAGKRSSLTVVGDFSQSVYSWRGADFRNLKYLERDYPRLKKIELTQNYRSSQNILDAAYGVIGNNTTHPILKLKAVADLGEKVSLYEARNERDEVNYILNKIDIGCDYSNYAILYRTNAQSRVLEEAFIRKSIPYVLIGGVRFYERKEIKDVLSYLRVIANESDGVGWERVEKIGKRRRAAFELWLGELKNNNQDTSKIPSVELLEGVLQSTKYLSLYNEKDESDLMRLENIKELASVASEFDNLIEFLENVSLVQSESGSGNALSNGVTLMTIHAAKGLEFEKVFVVGMEEGLFPHSRALIDKEQLEEERRLCYVAMTRAKTKLYLSCAQERLYFGSRSNNMPSRFLSEVPDYLLEKQKSSFSGYNNRQNTYSSEPVVKTVKVSPDELEYLTKDDFDEIDDW